MARRQGASGDRSSPPSLTRVAVRVHDLAQARVVLALARDFELDVRLASAPAAAGYAGIGFLAALECQIGQRLIADCGDDAALVMAGLRIGLGHMLFTGDPRTLAKLQDMAEQVGARVEDRLEAPVVSLEPQDREAAIRWRLSAVGTAE